MEDNTGCSATGMKTLPVTYPMITTYTQHAQLLSILESYEFTKGWIFSNFIQLYMNRDYKHNWGDFYFPLPYELRPSDTCKWILSQKIKRETVVKKWASATDFAVDCINSDNYVHTMLNYYYVPSSVRYKRLNLLHDMLIYGYDLDEKVFYIADFFRNGKYCYEVISFSDFEQAFNTYNIATNHDYLNGLIYLYNVNKNCDYEFSIHNITSSIKAYLDNSIPEYWDKYNRKNSENIVFNREVYNTLINYITAKMDDRSEIDIRPFFLLADHKKMMCLRIRYLCEQGYFKHNSQNENQLDEIERKAKTLVTVIIKYNITRNESCKSKAIALMNHIDKTEYDVLKQYINA